MSKRIALLLCVALMFVALFFISYKISAKIASKNAESKSESVSETQENVFTQPLSDETTSAEETAPAQTSAPEDDTTEFVPANDSVLPEPTVVNMPTDSDWCLVLLNKYYKMNDTYEPLVDMAIEDSGIYLDQRVAEKFREMYAAAMADGITLTPAAGYISLDRQERKFEKQVSLYMAGGMTEEAAKAKTAFTVLPAGCSESNYGLAVDIGWLSEDFSQSPAYAWLKNNAAEYGFIERYTAEKNDYTHFNAQPWHWRYVGADAAKEMNSQGLCLEEYLGKLN